MEELIRILDEYLQYTGHENKGEEIHIKVISKRSKVMCPYCGQESAQVHSRTKRTLKDLPIQGKKVKVQLESRKYFCRNPECAHKTFAERFTFFDWKATTTKRLQEEILRVSMTQSSIAASKYLKASVADVGKSTICNLLKKGRTE